MSVDVERLQYGPVSERTFVFVARTEPPRYARVDFEESTPYCRVIGPLDKEGMDDTFAPDIEEDKEAPGMYSDRAPFGYRVELADIQYDPNYPGGKERMAHNLARLVLAV